MRRIQRERLSDYFKFIRVTEGGRPPVRGDLLWGFLSNFSPHSTLILSVCVQLPLCLFFSACLCSPALSNLSVSSPTSAPFTLSFAFELAAVPPTPQPTDDVDIYFETPADDKEHSRFQRAKEQLEIRHRNRMDRVSYWVEPGHHVPDERDTFHS